MSVNQPLAIWNAVIATLKAGAQSGQPLALVGFRPTSVFDGIYVDKKDIPPGAYPAIMAELDENDEQFFTTGAPPALVSDFKIFLSIQLWESKPNKGIAGDSTLNPQVFGILQLESAVKNLLQADMSLGGTLGLQKISFPKTKYFFETFPIREAKMSVTLRNQLTTTSH